MIPAPALYNPTVLDHFLNPRNVGDVPEADAMGQAGQPGDGDTMRLSLRIKHGKILDARFKTLGCAAAIASSSMATELLKGRTLQEARHFSNEEVVAALGGLPPAKLQCSLLAAQALRAALDDYQKRHPGAPPPGR
ncbi:MAG TPA: iron-sulfur cluster assembly scaffold protein [Candidatus Acidoferrum sp.]|nr:iron-sulfur cluster assembly scaffold protein [Candidatus Acidoferrum sp.]